MAALHRHLYRGLSVLLLVPAVAAAAPVFVSGLDLCHLDDPTDPHLFADVTGAVTVETTTVDSTIPGNPCSLKLVPADTGAAYVEYDLGSGQTTLYAGFQLYVTSAPTARRRLLTFLNGSTVAGMITLEAQESGFRLRAFYEAEDTAADVGECSSSATMDGTECGGSCTTAADCAETGTATCSGSPLVCGSDCDEVNLGEAQCNPDNSGTSAFASSGTLAFDTWVGVMLGQVTAPDSRAGDVTLTLWAGTGGLDPQVFKLGNQTRPQGSCDTAASNTHYACGVDADCPGGTCTTTDVVAPDTVRFGTDDTAAGAFTYYVDGLHLDDADANPNVRIESLVPRADGSLTGWTGSYADVDDPGVPDGDTSALQKTNAINPEQDVVFSTPAAPTPASTPLAVAAEAVGKNHTTSGTAAIRLNLTDDTGTDTGATAFAYSGFSDSGNGADYHAQPNVTWATKQSGAAWDAAGVAALELQLDKTAGGGDDAYVSKVVVSVLRDYDDPILPTVLPDVDSDGVDTVCITGDSTINDAGFYSALTPQVLEAANIYDCALGGTTAGDVVDSLTGILEGDTAQYMACLAFKGSVGATCDVLAVLVGVNSLHAGALSAPEHTVANKGVGQMGFCDDAGGADDGAPCYCQPNGWRYADPASNGVFGYCRVKGAAFGTACANSSDCACTGNDDCCVSGTDSSCSDTVGTCSGGTCAQGIGCAVDGLSATGFGITAWCAPGCLDAPGCPDGVCVAQNQQAVVRQDYQAIAAAVAASATPPRLVWMTPAPVETDAITGLDACWGNIAPDIGALRHHLRGQSLVVDTHGVFLRDCEQGMAASCAAFCTAEENAQLCLRDAVHWTAYGQTLGADLLAACLTNDGETRTHDGVCTGGVCTDGQVGNACSADVDCALWRCDFS